MLTFSAVAHSSVTSWTIPEVCDHIYYAVMIADSETRVELYDKLL
jgi:hypothetical protein